MARVLTVSAIHRGRVGRRPAAWAHHGWGSYDASKPVTVAGKILTSKYENPHVAYHGPGTGQSLDCYAGANIAHDQSRSAGRNGEGGQRHLRVRLSFDGRERRNARRAHYGRWQDDRDALMLADAPAFLIAIEQSSFALAIRQSVWAYPAANVGHILALFLLGWRRVRDGSGSSRRLRAANPVAVVRGARRAAIAALVLDAGHRFDPVRCRSQSRGHEPGISGQARLDRRSDFSTHC